MKKEDLKIDSFIPTSHIDVGNFLYNHLSNIYEANREIIFLCIGSDRCTGDALGPLVGYKLKQILKNTSKFNIFIYGSLEYPIHAKNLIEINNKIQMCFKNPYIIAIDSSLGSINNIGKISISEDPTLPGLALNKNLPPIGNLSISGIVNLSGNCEFIILQNTRLYTVMSLADSITKGIVYCVNKIINIEDSILLQ